MGVYGSRMCVVFVRDKLCVSIDFDRYTLHSRRRQYTLYNLLRPLLLLPCTHTQTHTHNLELGCSPVC